MRTSEFYFFEEYGSSVKGKSERRFYVHSVHGDVGIHVDFIDEIAEKAKDIFFKAGDEYLFDKIIFYSSLNNGVGGRPYGKPHIEVTRKGTVVRGASSRSDLLHRLNEEILNVLKEVKEL